MRLVFSLHAVALSTALLMTTSASASAQPTTPLPKSAPTPAAAVLSSADAAPLSKGEIKAMREFKMLDFNGDGKLSRTEVRLFPRLAGAFDTADTNKDGFVSYEEVRAFTVQYRAERDRRRAEEAVKAARAAPDAAPHAAPPSSASPTSSPSP